MRKMALVLAIFALTSSAAASKVSYSYDANGRVTRVDYGNGKGYVYRYDATGRLVSRSALTAGRHRAVAHSTTQQPAKP